MKKSLSAKSVRVGDVLRLGLGDARVLRIEPYISGWRPDGCPNPLLLNMLVLPVDSELVTDARGHVASSRWLTFFASQGIGAVRSPDRA